jgi:hypothetical protein
MASRQELCDAERLSGNTFETAAVSSCAVVASPIARPPAAARPLLADLSMIAPEVVAGRPNAAV